MALILLMKATYLAAMMIAVVLVSTDVPVLAGGEQLITREQAMRIGNQRAKLLGLNLQSVTVRVDEDNREWEESMSYLRESSIEEFKAVARRYDARLAGHSFWSILYEPARSNGYTLKGGGATILVDKKTGKVLLAIRSV